jgi:protoporphyrinogen oxidase
MKGSEASVGVIGGGVAGLVATYRLLQHGRRVHLFEAGSSVGGLLRTFEIGGERIECFYHHLFTSDGAAVRLLDELTLLKTVQWRPTTAGIFYGDRVYPFTSTLDLLRFTPLAGIRDRIRLGLVGLRLRRERGQSKFEGVTALDWMRRNAGERSLRVVWEPLLRGKFGGMADQVPMTWLWNRIRLRFSSRGLLSQKEMLGYQLGSFGVWIDALVKLIEALGGEVETNSAVDRIAGDGSQLRIETAGGRAHDFDTVLVTISNEAFLQIAPPLGDEYAERLQSIAYQDAVCLVLSLRRPLTGHYWLSINDRSVPFLAVVEQTNLVDPERYGGRHVVYMPNYVTRGSSSGKMTEDERTALYLPHLKRINHEFDESWVDGRWLFQAADAQPVFTLGGSARLAGHRTPVRGLYLANMAQIYPQDRSQNYSILLGERIAEMISEDLSRDGIPPARGLDAFPAPFSPE